MIQMGKRNNNMIGWNHRNAGFFKLNFDGFVKISGLASSGFVIRDELGNIVVGGCIPISRLLFKLKLLV